jgi:DNA-binding phage protein
MSREKPGFLYFVHAPSVGMIKMGFTSSTPMSRMHALQAASPVPLELLGCLRGSLTDEAQLHVRFAAYRTHNEWFVFNDDIAGYVRDEVRSVAEILGHREDAKRGIGEQLRELILTRRGSTYGIFSAVAHDAGMSPQQLDGILSGNRRNPSVTTLSRILAVIGANLSDLTF